ncbi:hypothetical protein BLNAU_21508 [Blattamonas nauphoetae]|uniref:Uncharacterized protein n=1 Tax=Blattamonas nauphoetae TaxID=2049346 RepID=A0ABQ9WVQ2_9EUKA|nr:hypothetical protein BLNAU_21508 [Blattamonas nauphoetae]
MEQKVCATAADDRRVQFEERSEGDEGLKINQEERVVERHSTRGGWTGGGRSVVDGGEELRRGRVIDERNERGDMSMWRGSERGDGSGALILNGNSDTATLTLIRCRFLRCVSPSNKEGGAILPQKGKLAIVVSSFDSCSAGSGGAIATDTYN